MRNCECEKDVRLRAFKIGGGRGKGIHHYIEHMDGTKICGEGWSTTTMKPYPNVISDRKWEKMISKWNGIEKTTEANIEPM